MKLKFDPQRLITRKHIILCVNYIRLVSAMRNLNLKFRIVRCLANQVGRRGLLRSNGSDNNLQNSCNRQPKRKPSSRTFYDLNSYRKSFWKPGHPLVIDSIKLN